MSNGEHQESVLEARGLVKRYPEGRGELQVLNGVELTVRRGDIAAIIGTSGSGKSTLLNLLGGLDVPSEGTVQIGGPSGFEATGASGHAPGPRRHWRFQYSLVKANLTKEISILS